MEAKWVLTSSQKKIRFRNLLKKRKTETNKEKDPPGNSSEEPETMSEENTLDRSSISGSPKLFPLKQPKSLSNAQKIVNGIDKSSESHISTRRSFDSNRCTEGE